MNKIRFNRAGISRRMFLKQSAALLGASGMGGWAAAEVKRPNLLYVFPDELRKAALGFMQADPAQTPNIDRFAAEAVNCENAVSNYPVCSPYRAMLMSGQWPRANGVMTNCNSGQPDTFLDTGTTCFSDVLAAAGYDAGYIGKYHLDFPDAEAAKYGEGPRGNGVVWDAYTPPGPRRHGFSFWHSYGCCDKHLTPHYWVGDAPVSQPLEVKGWSVAHEAGVAIDFIKNKGGEFRDPAKPFALFVAFNPPHMPFVQVPDEYKARFAGKALSELLNRPNVSFEGKGKSARTGAADYFAAISGIDDYFGEMMAALDEAGLTEDTIVVFTTDHGEMMGSHGRMGKSLIYEESFNIPFLLRYPARLRPRTEPLHLNVPDVMPTLLGLMGLGESIPESVQGKDRSGVFLETRQDRPATSYFLRTPDAPDSGERGIRGDRYTLEVRKEGGKPIFTLYDRKTDPYQMKNIAAEQPVVLARLVPELNRWLEETGDAWGPIQVPEGE